MPALSGRKMHPSTLCFCASLGALTLLADKKRYTLVDISPNEDNSFDNHLLIQSRSTKHAY